MKISNKLFNGMIIGMVIAGLLMSGPGAIDYFMIGDFEAIYGTMVADKPYIESVRELGGLLIAGFYLTVATLK